MEFSMKNHERVRMRAHRSLKALPQYRDLIDAKNPIPGYAEDISLRNGEALIGVYENFSGDYDESIIVTDMGLWFCVDEKWDRVDYSEIKEAHHEPEEKLLANQLVLKTNERVFAIPIRGKGPRGTTRDVFSFYHFIIRVAKWYIRKDPPY
jgi:hypothetical protein